MRRRRSGWLLKCARLYPLSENVPSAPHRGRLGMNVRFDLQPQSILRLAIASQLAACSAPVAMPKVFGDCMGVDDASCAAGGYGGSTIVPRSEAGAAPEEDSGGGAPIEDTGTCGLGALQITPANPLCVPCISMAAPTGCCEAASACSIDPACPARIECGALGALGLASCPSTEDVATAQFLGCLEQNCNSQCSDIILELGGEQ